MHIPVHFTSVLLFLGINFDPGIQIYTSRATTFFSTAGFWEKCSLPLVPRGRFSFLYRWIVFENVANFLGGFAPEPPIFFSFLVKILNWWISSVVISFISFLLVCGKSQLMNLISCRSILKIILSNLISEGRVRLFFYQFCALMASVREKYRWEFSFNDYLCSEISHSLMLRVESIRETAACISLHFL